MLSGNKKFRIIQTLLPIIKYGSILRLVDISDAAFIFRLRTDPKLSRFIHKVSNNIEDQIVWIDQYKFREEKGEEFYFISLDAGTGTPQGLSRIYNFNHDEFELGSWIYLPDTDVSKSILGDIAVREIAFDNLLFNTCRFEVRKSNKSVVRYHKGFSPELIGEDGENYYFKLTKATFNRKKFKYLNTLGYGFS